MAKTGKDCVCEVCGDPFYAQPSLMRAGRTRFCSHPCYWKSKQGKDPTKHTSVSCKQCGREFESYVYRGKTRKFCSAACADAHGRHVVTYVTVSCAQCGASFSGPPSVMAKRRYCSHRCGGVAVCARTPYEGTGIERKLEKMLVQLEVTFKRQHPIANITVPDFFVEPNVAIYADGTYWHSLPKMRRSDTHINNQLPKLGYRVLRFPEYQINNAPSDVLDRLRAELVK